MQILLLSFQIRPDSAFASNRALKLAKFLLSRGHDVRILTADDPSALSVDFERNRILSVPVPERGGFGSVVWGKVSFTGSSSQDPSVRWRRPALNAAKVIFAKWKPDVLLAACPSHSNAILAAQISLATDVPFVADFSERWALGSAGMSSRQRSAEKQKERAVLSRSAGVITTSPVWAESYARLLGASKVVLALNGFDPDEYPLSSPVEPDADRNVLNVFCTSPFQSGGAEPRLLFRGVAALGEGAKDIRITIVGDHAEEILAMAKEERVHKQLDLHPIESRGEIIERQYAADALAVTLAPDAHEVGHVASELFDCIGTRRPVVGCGWGKGVNADIIRKRDLGVVSNEPKVIANTLARLLAKKRAVGVVPMLPDVVRNHAAMSSQFAGIEPLLYDTLGNDALQIAAE